MTSTAAFRERTTMSCPRCRNRLCGLCLLNMDRQQVRMNVDMMSLEGDVLQQLCRSAGERLSLRCPFCKAALEPKAVQEAARQWIQRWLTTDDAETFEQLLMKMIFDKLVGRLQGELLWQRTLQTQRKRKLQRLLETFS